MKNNQPTPTVLFAKVITAVTNLDDNLQLLIQNISSLNTNEYEELNKEFDGMIQTLAFMNKALNSIYQGRKKTSPDGTSK